VKEKNQGEYALQNAMIPLSINFMELGSFCVPIGLCEEFITVELFGQAVKERVTQRMDIVAETISDQMQGKPEQDARQQSGIKEQVQDNQQEYQLVGMEDDIETLELVPVAFLEEILHVDPEPKVQEIIDEVVQVNEDAREHSAYRENRRPGNRVNRPTRNNRNDDMLT
jgi:hypothetical protein